MSKVRNKKIKDGFTRNRTGNVETDLACTGRARLNNPKDLEANINYENCQVCGRSFKKGRGLNIHMSVTTCRATLERRNRRNKSESGTTQESHHSGGTTEPRDPPHSPVIELETKTVEHDKGRKEDDVLIIDDEIEKAIKKSL